MEYIWGLKLVLSLILGLLFSGAITLTIAFVTALIVHFRHNTDEWNEFKQNIKRRFFNG